MKLCIAEKPSVAREIANILGAKSKRNGYFEGNGYWISWTFGHLCTLKAPDDYTPLWKSWGLASLPMIPARFGIKVIPDSGVQKQFDIITELVEKSEEVINCGDAGIEGELIQRWVLTKAKCRQPVKRLWISSLTEEAIREGFEKLKDASEYDLLYAAGNARAIGDWLLGMNASRLFTLKYAQNKGVLSVGRVQTPTLAMIVERHNEIQNFKPEKYWELKTIYRDTLFSAQKGKFKTQEEGNEIVELIKDKPFVILSSEKKKGKEAPLRLFDLTSLQVECNKKFSFSADETLKLIQSLYEKKLVTYPRVDTTYLPNDMYPKVSGILKGLKSYSEYTNPLLGNKIRKSKKVFDDKKITDHHAIIPTGVYTGSLNDYEGKVYDTITRRFISVFYPDCIVSNTIVHGESEKVKFKATGKEILDMGWRVLYPSAEKKKTTNDNEAQIMPSFVKGESGSHKPQLQEKQTQPPKLYTEATLLRMMETAGKHVDDDELRDAMKENGIGRPSTRAAVIETLFKRNYIRKIRKSLEPTTTGIQLIETIHNPLLKSVELTGQWEKKLRQIESNQYDAKTFIEEMKKMVWDLVVEVKNENHKTIEMQEDIASMLKKSSKRKKKTESTDITCPVCKNGKMLKGKSAWGCSAYKDGCKFIVPFTHFEKRVTDKQIKLLVNKGKTESLKGFTVDGEKKNGYLLLNDDFKVDFKEDSKVKKEPSLTCPKCNKGKMLKGKSAYGCSEYKEGCHFIIKFDSLKEKFGDDKLDKERLSVFL
ncbi:MAG: DNA topoisomerase 3 [Hyphomicrobiales bacterium]